jgi:hypothetical protein
MTQSHARGGAQSVRGTTGFFRTRLTLATGASVAGNVVHAILNSPKGSIGLAAAAAPTASPRYSVRRCHAANTSVTACSGDSADTLPRRSLRHGVARAR